MSQSSTRTLSVCMLQGSVASAVKHSKVKDKAIKDLFGNINLYSNDVTPPLTLWSILPNPKPVVSLNVVFLSGIQCEVVDNEVIYRLGGVTVQRLSTDSGNQKTNMRANEEFLRLR